MYLNCLINIEILLSDDKAIGIGFKIDVCPFTNGTTRILRLFGYNCSGEQKGDVCPVFGFSILSFLYAGHNL